MMYYLMTKTCKKEERYNNNGFKFEKIGET